MSTTPFPPKNMLGVALLLSDLCSNCHARLFFSATASLAIMEVAAIADALLGGRALCRMSNFPSKIPPERAKEREGKRW